MDWVRVVVSGTVDDRRGALFSSLVEAVEIEP